MSEVVARERLRSRADTERRLCEATQLADESMARLNNQRRHDTTVWRQLQRAGQRARGRGRSAQRRPAGLPHHQRA
eukprot:11581883-Alexandrium_andersonii.AAC.1